jgi:hypothetical protein
MKLNSNIRDKFVKRSSECGWMYISWTEHCDYNELKARLVFLQMNYVAKSRQLPETKDISSEILKYISIKGRVTCTADVNISFNIYEN